MSVAPTAFANAVGAVVGSAALLYLLREQGETLMETAFPTVLPRRRGRRRGC